MPGKQWAAARLAQVRSGLGAARLAEDVVGLTVWIGHDNGHGRMGCRKFWREHLPRIQFHNPQLSITVQRAEHNGQAALHIHRVTGTTIVDMRHKHSDEICRALLEHAGSAQAAA